LKEAKLEEVRRRAQAEKEAELKPKKLVSEKSERILREKRDYEGPVSGWDRRFGTVLSL
jgi:hypothetical protein